MTIPVLMTASIDAKGMSNALFTPLEREKQYIEVINEYIKRFSRIQGEWQFVFVENSGWPKNRILSNIQSTENVNFEYIALDPDVFDIRRGKGYNEMLMIDLALQESQLIQKQRIFFKVTGRYVFVNLYNLLTEVEKNGGENLCFYADVKDHALFDILHIPINGHWGECRYYAVSLDFWNKNMRGMYKFLDDKGWSIESFFLYLVRKVKHQKGVYIRFKTQPRIKGYGGFTPVKGVFTGNNHYNSFGNKVKDIIRQVLRYVVPFWWC